MNTDVQWPIGLLLKDCQEVQLYASVDELEDSIEEIDVENQEYSGWDADSCPVELHLLADETGLRVRVHSGGHWLDVRRQSGRPQPEEFKRAIQHYARMVNVHLDRISDEVLIDYLSRVEREAERFRRERMQPSMIRKLFRRLLG